MVKAQFKNIITITNSIDHEFLNGLLNVETKTIYDNLFICRDLRDERKIDWKLLEQVSKLSNQTLTIIGDNPPFKFKDVNYLNAINDTRDLYLRPWWITFL